MNIAVLSDQGLVRSNNEDNYLVNEKYGLLVVCDGMGGHNGGEIASAMAIEIIQRRIASHKFEQTIEMLNDVIAEANEFIFNHALKHLDLHGMGTTLTAAMINEKTLSIAHIGDSSLFLIRDSFIKKITHDHTLAEQMIIESLLSANEAIKSPYNHVLTRALGVEEQVKIDNYFERLKNGDIILLCSDGLTDLLSQSEMKTIVQKSNSLKESANNLVISALDRGGSDNITVILASI